MAGKKKLLIVDDEPDVIAVLYYRLEGNGYELVGYPLNGGEVKGATNKKDALEIVKKNKPDLVILNLGIDGKATGGIDIYQELRGDENYQTKPVLFTTADNSDKMRQRLEGLRKDGTINDYIFLVQYKPETLIGKIEGLIRKNKRV